MSSVDSSPQPRSPVVRGLLGFLLVAALFVLVWWLAASLASLTQVLILLASLLVGALLLDRFIPLFGPVLYYDMVRTARQGRQVWMRGVYALLLLFLLLVCFLGSRHYVGMTTAQAEARLAETFFEFFMPTQLILVVLLTPAYVGGAIAE